MRKPVAVLTVAAALALASSARPAASDEAKEQQLGNVHFETSCNEVAQRRFDRAMRYQHSFWYGAAKDIFEETLKADPNCAIAYWGIALSLWNNPHNPPPAPNLAPALAAIEKAQAVGAKTERERTYIEALAVLYKNYDKTDYRTRLMAFRDAMAALAAKYPNDDEAQIAYAITLNVSASPADKTYSQQLKGAAILEPIWKRQPMHPGIAHYLIHLYDYPALAERGLSAADRYAKIAPAAPHAQHMPSHIYTRVGYWQQSVSSNIASVKAARADKEYGDQLHGEDYMVYAYLQLARDGDARAVIDDMLTVKTANPSAFGSYFAIAASPARYAIERGDWNAAAQLEVRDKLREGKNAYWAQQVDIEWQVASAWVLNAEGKHNEALKAMSAAADTEDTTEKSPVTPGPLAPARELYGDMLLEQGKAKEALAAFEATKAKEPNRFRGFAGAAQAAEKLGDKAAAKANYQKLLALVGETKSDRPVVAVAQRYVASN